MMKPTSGGVLKFILLTLWVLIVSLTTFNFSSHSALEQSAMVDDCKRYARNELGVDLSEVPEVYIENRVGAYNWVLLTSDFTSTGSVHCYFDGSGEFKGEYSFASNPSAQ